MTNRKFDDDPTEIKKLIEYHNCIPMRRHDGVLGIQNPLTCKYLKTKKGKCLCMIQDEKPKVCADYFCKKVLDKAVKEIAGGLHL